MTYEEVQRGLLDLFADPTKADPSKSNDFLTKLRDDYTDHDARSERIKSLEDENKRLKERNAYYAQLAVGRLDAKELTGKEVPEEEEEENEMQTPEDLDRFLAETRNPEEGKED